MPLFKKSRLVVFFSSLLLAVCLMAMPVMDAQAKTTTTHVQKKKSHNFRAKYAAKKKGKKKTVKNAPAKKAYRMPVEKPVADEVSEPSEMILAIKNRAERAFWNGKKPLKEQQNAATLNNASGQAFQKSETLARLSASDVAGVTFDDQPLAMPESEAFRRSLDTVAFELGRPCKKREQLGWPLQQTEQGRVDRIFTETNEKLKLRGYSITPRNPRSVGGDVSVFTADRAAKHVLGMWSAGDVGLLLLLCETETPSDALSQKSEPAKKAMPAKKKTKKKSVRKKVAPLIPADATAALPGEAAPPATETKRPEVIPGASKADVKNEAPKEMAPSAVAPAVKDEAAVGADKPAPAFVPAPDVKKEEKPAAPAPEAPKPEAPKTEGTAAPIVVPSAPVAPVVPALPAVNTTAPTLAPQQALPAGPKPAAIVAPAVEAVKDAAKDAAIDAAKDAVKKELPAVPSVPTVP